MAITREDFDFVKTLVRQRSAIVLETGKEYLAENRLNTLAREEGYSSLDELMNQLRGPNANLKQKVVEAMTTNETYFFRDQAPFEMIKKSLLPNLIRSRHSTRTIRIWSAACSTGQEPYSLAMMIREDFPEIAGWKLEIVATDLATSVLDKAREGRYRQFDINRGLPVRMLPKYFTKDGADWVLNSLIRSMVTFQTLNLVMTWPLMPIFDLILLRNVLIYFDQPTRTEILRKARRCISSDGALLLGCSETAIGTGLPWTSVDCPPGQYFRPV